jgi:hypothetical protein
VPKAPEVQIQLVEKYRQYAVLSIEELWLRCFELGGMNTQLQIDAFLHGIIRPTPHEHNLMAVALNQYFMEFDPSRFAPYIEDGFANTTRSVGRGRHVETGVDAQSPTSKLRKPSRQRSDATVSRRAQ